MGFLSRIGRGWKGFQSSEPDSGYYVIEDKSPIGFRIIHQARTFSSALSWRREHAAGLAYQIVSVEEYDLMAVTLMKNHRFWAAWADLATMAGRHRDHLALEKAVLFAAVAERGPETGSVSRSAVAGPGEPFDPKDLYRAADRVHLAEVAQRARGRVTPPDGVEASLFTKPHRPSVEESETSVSQSLPEGVVWNDEA